jgi:hypothetical protein
MEHLRTLRDVSRAINGHTGKVVHEIICDGSVHFGNNPAPGDTNETALFATAVDLLWRWSGDEGLRDEMYEFILDGMRYITSELDTDGDLWPEGNGIAERPGMGSEQIDAAAVTLTCGRLTPSIWPINSCLSGKLSRPTRSWVISIQRHKRSCLECRRLQAAPCVASTNNAWEYRCNTR